MVNIRSGDSSTRRLGTERRIGELSFAPRHLYQVFEMLREFVERNTLTC